MARIPSVMFPGRAAGDASSHSLSYCFVLAMLFIGLPNVQCQIDKMYIEVDSINLLVDETRLFKLVQILKGVGAGTCWNLEVNNLVLRISNAGVTDFEQGKCPVQDWLYLSWAAVVNYHISGEYNTTLQVEANIQHPDIIQFVPQTISIPGVAEPNATAKWTHDICAYGKSPGHSEVTFNATPAGIVNLDSIFLRVTVMHSHAITIISYIMGWIYFAAWSISFYPQIYINFRRKSVVGLNFDFLALNIMGFTLYSLFNCGLYFSELIQSQYFARHPRSLNPVQLNDVFFSLHAAFATIITIIQCFIYERERQRVSITGRGILGAFICVVIITASLGAANTIEWLDFLYYCSYIKLCITLIKYVPQAYMNYKRKSTVGWSIGNIFLDFVGGSLSILQMALNAYNYDDWISFFGDATKFGLGLFSLVFDIFFILQHYVFYRRRKEFMVDESSDEGSNMTRSGDGSEYFLVRRWHADEKKYDLDAKV